MAIAGGVTRRRELVTSARRAFYCVAALVILAVVLLEAAYVRTDLSFELVARNSSDDTPLFYKLTAMWSSQEGSLLLWALLLSVYSSVVLFARAAGCATSSPTRPACSRSSRPSSCR